MKDGKFEPGDLVYLKSGSQKMTVLRILGEDDGYYDNTVVTGWMVYETATMREHEFPSEALELAADKGNR